MNKENTVPITKSIAGSLALIGFNNPPVNALNQSLRQELLAAINEFDGKAGVEVIMLYGCGRIFCAGADIKEFSDQPKEPFLPDICNRIEAAGIPIIAILHGAALGGGLEIALAAHGRIGLRDLKLGFPEVQLGLIPGAGGTQRLPRLAGLAPAIDMIISGRQLAAKQALSFQILDDIYDGYEEFDDPAHEAALAAGRAVLSGKLPTKRTGSITVNLDNACIEAARARLQNKRPRLAAPIAAIDALAHAGRPISEGLLKERELFLELMKGPDRQGLVHAFKAERTVKHIPEASARPRPINMIGVVGGGTMGTGIAISFLQGGFPVRLIESDKERTEKAVQSVKEIFERQVSRGHIDEEKRQNCLDLLTSGSDLQLLAGSDLVIEAVYEDMAAKIDIFQKLDDICKPSAILATNTSYLDVNHIAGKTHRASDVVGLHFFSPAHRMRLLEVVVGADTSPDVVATAFDLATKLKKIAVRSAVCEGFIGNRILAHYRKAADYLLLEGASFAQIDEALEAFGFAMGPFATADLAGLDIAYAFRKQRHARRPRQERYVKIADRICEQGWFGRKSGRGYYLYQEQKQRMPNPGAIAIMEEERVRSGSKLRSFSDDEIVSRYICAMINEAARIIEEKIALRPIDVDAVLLFGYGFPRHCGGPLAYADHIGIGEVMTRMQSYAGADPYFWQIADILHRLQESGKNFADLNDQSQ